MTMSAHDAGTLGHIGTMKSTTPAQRSRIAANAARAKRNRNLIEITLAPRPVARRRSLDFPVPAEDAGGALNPPAPSLPAGRRANALPGDAGSLTAFAGDQLRGKEHAPSASDRGPAGDASQAIRRANDTKEPAGQGRAQKPQGG